MARNGQLRRLLGIILLLGAILLARLWFYVDSDFLDLLRHRFVSLLVDAKAKVDNFEDVLIGAGYWGPVYVFFVYIVSTIFFLPLWGFHLACGYAYGTVASSLLISTTQGIAAGISFSIARYLLGKRVRDFLGHKYGAKFAAIDRAISEKGFIVTLLLRLSPIIPFGLNNYVCGCTDMDLWKFMLATFIGVLPGTTAYCNLGAMGKKALEEGTTSSQKFIVAVGVVAGIAVVKLISNLATKALKDAGIGNEDADNVPSQVNEHFESHQQTVKKLR